MGCWAGFETEKCRQTVACFSLCRWKCERDREKLIERDSILQQSGRSDTAVCFFLYLHAEKNILPVSSSIPSQSIYPFLRALRHAHPHTLTPALVCLCVHGKHSDMPAFCMCFSLLSSSSTAPWKQKSAFKCLYCLGVYVHVSQRFEVVEGGIFFLQP